MKKFRLLGFALIAVFAFSVVSVAASSAAVTLLAEWLIGGTAVAATTGVSSKGELELIDPNVLKAGILGSVLCVGTLDGTIGPNGTDEITAVLTAAGVEINKLALAGTALTCTKVAGCEEEISAWAVNLPWSSELNLVEETGFTGFADVLRPKPPSGGNPGWYVKCLGALKIEINDECTTPRGAAEKINVATGVEDIFTLAFTNLLSLKLALCTSSGEEDGEVIGKGITIPNSGTGLLTVSSTG